MPAAARDKTKMGRQLAEAKPHLEALAGGEKEHNKEHGKKAEKLKSSKHRMKDLAAKKVQKTLPVRSSENARVLTSKVSYQGPLFRVMTEEVSEPDGKQTTRDVIRHNGSVVILAIDSSKSKKDPRIIMEQQYRHAAGQYLIELPAGKLEPGEDSLEAAKRELIEETGYRAKHWTKLVRYFASPGFLGEWMQVYLAEGLTRGEAEPEDDESIDVAAIPMSKILKLIEKGKILDGKTLVSLMLYDRLRRGK